MKIRKIKKAVGYRIFKNFVWPDALPAFSRFNVIYGWNGSGKTSLSNLFRHIQRRAPLLEGSVELLIDDASVAGADFSAAVLPAVRVFNRDTIDRNVFEQVGHQFPAVFFLGEDNVEKQQAIEELSVALDVASRKQARWDRKKFEATNARDALCADEARGIKNLLTVAGGGRYNNYNAANFRSAVQTLAVTAPSLRPLTQAERQEALATKDGRPMATIPQPTASFPDVVDLARRSHKILQHSVVSSVMADLADSPEVAMWAADGLKLHTDEHASPTCRFCEQLLPAKRLQQLEAHFNDGFREFIASIDTLANEIRTARGFEQSLKAAPAEALYEHLRGDYVSALSALRQHAVTVQMSLDTMLSALEAKKQAPFKKIELWSFIHGNEAAMEPGGRLEAFFRLLNAGVTAVSTAMGQTSFEKLGSLIQQHNMHTERFDAEVESARSRLVQDELLKALPKWAEQSQSVGEASDEAERASGEVKVLRQQIEALERQMRQHRRPAEQLNREVASYLGRDELHFDVEQNGYRITRGGQSATHLSDGERTAIAFLYFLKSLQGTDFDLANGIVVIDDPVSSLDANSLFSAFAFMKQRTASAGQLFILTHNFSFFRQVRNWYYAMPQQKKSDARLHPARFMMLGASFEGGVRSATLQALDPLLHEYESEYHYLFKRVHQEASAPVAATLEAYYSIPNLARRLLESFLAFRVPQASGELFHKLETIAFDPAKKTRILRFLHTYSHFDQIAEPHHDPSVLSETPGILQDLLALIRDCDPTHYAGMASLLESNGDT